MAGTGPGSFCRGDFFNTFIGDLTFSKWTMLREQRQPDADEAPKLLVGAVMALMVGFICARLLRHCHTTGTI